MTPKKVSWIKKARDQVVDLNIVSDTAWEIVPIPALHNQFYLHAWHYELGANMIIGKQSTAKELFDLIFTLKTAIQVEKLAEDHHKAPVEQEKAEREGELKV